MDVAGFNAAAAPFPEAFPWSSSLAPLDFLSAPPLALFFGAIVFRLFVWIVVEVYYLVWSVVLVLMSMVGTGGLEPQAGMRCNETCDDILFLPGLLLCF